VIVVAVVVPILNILYVKSVLASGILIRYALFAKMVVLKRLPNLEANAPRLNTQIAIQR